MRDAYLAEQKKIAREVLRCLALGLDPKTRQSLSDIDVLEQPAVIRALLLAIEAIEGSGPPRPGHGVSLSRVGQSWDSAEDDELRDEFGQRLSLSQMSAAHKRTSGSIVARLVHLKLVNARDDARRILGQNKIVE